MSRNLLNYLPYEIRKYKDYQVITESENHEFTKLFELSQSILDDSFIETASEYGVSKFEKMLNIFPHEGDSLRDRKVKLLIWWNNQVPYTWRVLIEKLNAICGVGKYTVKLVNNEYRLEIDSQLNSPSQYEDLRFLLDTMIPCNMVIISTNTLKSEVNRTLNLSTVVTEFKKITIDSNLNVSNKVSDLLNYNSLISELKSITVHGDTNVNINPKSNVRYTQNIKDFKVVKIKSEELI